MAGVSLRSDQTRERILSAALRLFNAEGTSRINTHDIARAAGISPGNLYYHYPDKQAIVRDIFDDIPIYRGSAWSPHRRATDFKAFLDFYLGSIWKYRFFFRDFSLLLKSDPKLSKEWRSAWRRLQSMMRRTLRLWVKEGVIKPFADRPAEDEFIDTAWILSHFWPLYCEARFGPRLPRDPAGGFALLYSFLRPYHTSSGRRELDRYFGSHGLDD